MGMLKQPRESGLTSKPHPTVLERVVKWRKQKAKKSKFQKDFEKGVKKEFRGFYREVKKGTRDIMNGP